MEVWLIGRDNNFIGQILEVFKVKKKNKRKRRRMFSKINCG